MNAFVILTGKKFDSEMLYQSQIYGRLDFIKYLHNKFNGIPCKFTIIDAMRTARYGHLDCMIYILDHLQDKTQTYVLYVTAIEYNQFHIFSYLLKQNFKYNLFHHVDCLNRLQEEPNIDFDDLTLRNFFINLLILDEKRKINLLNKRVIEKTSDKIKEMKLQRVHTQLELSNKIPNDIINIIKEYY